MGRSDHRSGERGPETKGQSLLKNPKLFSIESRALVSRALIQRSLLTVSNTPAGNVDTLQGSAGVCSSPGCWVAYVLPALSTDPSQAGQLPHHTWNHPHQDHGGWLLSSLSFLLAIILLFFLFIATVVENVMFAWSRQFLFFFFVFKLFILYWGIAD